MLPQGAIVAFYGRPGAKKSFVVLDIAACVSAGLPWQGQEVRGGPSLYVASEGSAGMSKRIEAWKQTFRVPSLPDLHVFPDVMNLLDSDASELLARVAKALKARLVVIDTLNRSIPGGDENAPKDMSRFVAAVDRIRKLSGATVVIVHHVARKEDNFRGHSLVEGALDTKIRVEADGMAVTLRCEKQKDSEEFPAIALEARVVPVTMPLREGQDRPEQVSSLVFSRSQKPVGTYGVASETTQAALRALWDHFGTSGGASASAWLEVAGLPKTTFYRAREALLKDGFVEDTNPGRSTHYRVTEAGQRWLGVLEVP
jgi:AAA domain